MKKLFFTFISAGLIIFMPSCNKNIDDDPGRLVIKVTDAPFPIEYIESAAITITKVEIRKACDGVCDDYPFMVLMEDTVTFNLIELRNGVVEELLNLEIPDGSYDLIRLYIDHAALTIKDGGEYEVKVPSGQQTGIKIFLKPALQVEGGLSAELLLDFDLSRSFVVQGNPLTPAGIRGFIFKPVIRAVNNSTAGRIEGMVTDTAMIKIKEATLWIKQDTLVTTTIADTSGYYSFIGLPAGTYDIFATKENFDTVGYENVKVVAGNKTILNFVLTPDK